MWNYRVVRTVEKGETLCQVQEVYYDAKKRPNGYCDIGIQGETPEDCIKDVAWIMAAFYKPVLNYPADFHKNKKSTKSKGGN